MLEKRFFIGRVSSKDGIMDFDVEYYVVEKSKLYSIAIVKEQGTPCGEDREIEAEISFPISESRRCVESLARKLMSNLVTPRSMYECLDDLYEVWC